MKTNYYELLNVSTFATKQEIEKQFQIFVTKLFPKLDHDAKSKNDMLELSLAYQTLINDELREEYLKKFSTIEIMLINYNNGEVMSKYYNYYELLNVSLTATSEEITINFKNSLAYLFSYIEPNQKLAEKIMKDLVVAYKTLTNENSRKEYDQKLLSESKNANELNNHVKIKEIS